MHELFEFFDKETSRKQQRKITQDTDQLKQKSVLNSIPTISPMA